MLVVPVLAVLAVSLHSWTFRTMSPYDEQQHFDYVYKAGRLQLPGDNERYGSVTMRETACRGIDTPGMLLPPCDSAEFTPEDFPDYGYNTAAAALPAYYFPTGLLGRLVVVATPISNEVLAARFVGGVWLGFGLAVMLALMRELGARLTSSVAVALLLLTTPVVVTASAYVTTDAVLFLVGSSVPLTVVLWRRGRVRLWLPALVAVAALAVDSASLVALYLASVFVVHQAVNSAMDGVRVQLPGEERSSTAAMTHLRPIAVWSGVVLASVLLAERVLPGIRHLLTGEAGAVTADLPRFEWQQRPPFSLEVALRSYQNLVTPVDGVGGYVPPIAQDLLYRSVTATLSWLLIAGALGMAAWAAARCRLRGFGVAASVTLITAAPIFSVVMWLRGGLFYEFPPRYGLAMLPALGVALAASTRRAATVVFVSGLALLQVTLFMSRLV